MRVHRDAGPDLVAVEHVQHAEDAGAVAVLALRPGAVVGTVAAELADEARVLVAALVRQQLASIRDAARTQKATRALRGQASLGRFGKGA